MPQVSTNLLQDLRDIHYPEPLSWWPLAPGWYLLALISVVMVGGVGYFLWRWIQSRRRKERILRRFASLNSMARQANGIKAVMELGVLLKQVALKIAPREEVAGLRGEPWLKFLDQTGKTHAFTHGVGRLLLTAPYQAGVPNDITALFQLAGQWLRRQLRWRIV